jgi:hypothetical protein
MLYTVLLFIIILLTVAIYAEKIKKSEHFSSNDGNECYGKISSKNGYYSNFMLNTFSNFDTAFRFLKNKSIKAINSLKQYKVDLEQAYDIDAVSQKALEKTTKDVSETNSRLNNLVDSKINQYDNELALSNVKLGDLRKSATTLSDIKEDEVMTRVTDMVSNVAKDRYNNYEKKTVNSPRLGQTFNTIIKNKISDNRDVSAYNWQCEPGIIGAPIRINSKDGSIEALSTNGVNIDTAFCKNNDVRDIPHKNIKPVVCSNKDASTAGNWCNKAAKVLYNQDTTDYNNCPLDWRMVDREKKICIAPKNTLGNSVHDSNSQQFASECALPNNKCVMFGTQPTDNIMQWSKATNTLFPPKVNVVERARDLTNVLAQVDNVINSTIGTASPPSRIDNYTVYKNGVLVKAYKLKEINTANRFTKGKLLFDNIISSSIYFRVNNGNFLSIRPPYSDPNTNFDTDDIFVVFQGYMKIPKGISRVQLRTISDDGIRVMIRKPNTSNWSTVIENFTLHGDTANDSALMSVIPEEYIEYQIEFFEKSGYATCILQWRFNEDDQFLVVPRDSLFIDTEQCSKTVNMAKKNTWQNIENKAVRMNDRGDVECLSLDGRNCIDNNQGAGTYEGNIERYGDSSKLLPLACGEDVKSKYGFTGYENPSHWCAKAKIQLDPSNKRTYSEDTYGGRCGLIDGKKVMCLPGRCCNKYGYCGDSKFCTDSSINRQYNG